MGLFYLYLNINCLKLRIKIKYYVLCLMHDFEIIDGRSENKFKRHVLRCFASNLNRVCNSKITEIELYGTERKMENNMSRSDIMVLLYS